ncbi:MAG TPA: ATP-dependent metallopeptidase FtsH/Yme1/Tma family protein, partial [Solimonas sp.]|nr:ATP-dependent metallopeptidase FtsH/Yme1/Tma family protein [Solimonas sp.]
MNDLAKNLLLWVIILVVLMVVFQSFSSHSRSQSPLAYSEFIEQVKDGNVGEVTIDGQVIRGEMKGGTPFV